VEVRQQLEALPGAPAMCRQRAAPFLPPASHGVPWLNQDLHYAMCSRLLVRQPFLPQPQVRHCR